MIKHYISDSVLEDLKTRKIKLYPGKEGILENFKKMENRLKTQKSGYFGGTGR